MTSTTKAWVFLRCARTAVPLTAHLQLKAGTWTLMETSEGAEPENSEPSVTEPSVTELEGAFGVDAGYPGCGGCGGKAYYLCSSCKRLACCQWWTRKVRCPSCGHQARIRGRITALSADDVG